MKTRLGDGTEVVEWKIWNLSTILDNLDIHPENEALLYGGRKILEKPSLTTDVVIIGGGNSAISLAARLKAFGVESIMVERNAQPGDNWRLRYDCMKCKQTLPFFCLQQKLSRFCMRLQTLSTLYIVHETILTRGSSYSHIILRVAVHE